MDDLISRQAAIDKVDRIVKVNHLNPDMVWFTPNGVKTLMEDLPSAEPEPLSDAYMDAVWIWLIDYQIKAAELKGRYTPYEVLSWVVNDWRKEHERSD